jgi:hypothetical protein
MQGTRLIGGHAGRNLFLQVILWKDEVSGPITQAIICDTLLCVELKLQLFLSAVKEALGRTFRNWLPLKSRV